MWTRQFRRVIPIKIQPTLYRSYGSPSKSVNPIIESRSSREVVSFMTSILVSRILSNGEK